MGANDPRGRAIFEPRGMVGRIYKEDHYTLLHTKYKSSVPCGFGEEDFFFSYVFLMTPSGQGPYRPQGHGMTVSIGIPLDLSIPSCHERGARSRSVSGCRLAS